VTDNLLTNFIQIDSFEKQFLNNKSNFPFDHWVFEEFFNLDVAKKLEGEFPAYDDKVWYEWNNPLEIKKARNDWNSFPPLTYKVINALNSNNFLNLLKKFTGVKELYSDSGLNGAGWHIHPSGGHNNVHLDYSIHPKLGYQRKFNLIIYLNDGWEEKWGGSLGFYEQDKKTKKPGKLVKEVAPLFNRAVFFDTTQDSWHGLPDPIDCPSDVCRKSIAMYYLIPALHDADPRGRALFAPQKGQEKDKAILELIEKRAGVNTSKDVYITKS
jgi:hypothetical protein